jgi:hypothetical protein
VLLNVDPRLGVAGQQARDELERDDVAPVLDHHAVRAGLLDPLHCDGAKTRRALLLLNEMG